MAPKLERAARARRPSPHDFAGSGFWAAGALVPVRGAAWRPRRAVAVAGRSEPRFARAHWGSAPRAITVSNELAKESLWGGRSPPNGSRLSCGRPARRRSDVKRQFAPARAQHSASFKTITARQLQALVRRPLTMGEAEAHVSAGRLLLGLLARMVPRHLTPGHVAARGSPQLVSEGS